MTKSESCTLVIGSNTLDFSAEPSKQPSLRYGAHRVNPEISHHSPVKFIVAIALVVFVVPMTFTMLKQTDEDRQNWVNTHPQYQDHTAANLAQIFQTLRQLLV